MFIVHHKSFKFTTYDSKTAQNACRKAFRNWISLGLIKRQPRTDHSNESTFQGVQVEYHAPPY